MLLGSFSHKCKYVDQRVSKIVRHELESTFQELLLEFFPSIKPSGAFAKSLCLDTTYALLRHFTWSECESFKHLFLESLKDDYDLPTQISQDFLSRYQAKISTIDVERYREGSSAEFYLYLVTQLTQMNSYVDAGTELGLSTNLILLFRAAIAHQNIKSHDPITRQFLEALEILSDTQTQIPWACDIYELYFHLKKLPKVWVERFTWDKTKALLELCFQIGKSSSMEEAEFTKVLADLTGGDSGGIDALERLDILYRFRENARKHTQNTVKLSAMSERLTATLAARSLGYSPEILENLPKIPAPWHAALVKLAPADFISSLMQAVQKKPTVLAPSAWIALGEQIRSKPELVGSFGATLIAMLKNSKIPELRSSACETLSRLTLSAKTRGAIVQIAKQDPSHLVREKLTDLLLNNKDFALGLPVEFQLETIPRHLL